MSLTTTGKCDTSKSSTTSGACHWSFDLGLSILQTSKEPNQLEALDSFLTTNASVLSNPLYLNKVSDEELNSLELSIRGIKATVTESLKDEAIEVSTLLETSKIETLRLLYLTTRRTPEADPKSEINEDIRALYVSNVLRERQKVLELSRYVLTHGAFPVIGDKYCQKFLENSDYITNCIELLDQLMFQLNKNDANKYRALITTELAFTIIHVLKLLLSLLIKVSTTSPNVSKWFKFWERNKFFEDYKSFVSIETYEEIKGLISLTSLQFLGLDTTTDYFDSVAPYVNDPEALKTINESLSNAPVDSIVLYAWSIIIYTLTPEISEKAFPDLDNLSNIFAAKAAELDVFTQIEKYHNVLSYDNFHSAVFASFLIAVVPFIQLTDKTSNTYLSVLQKSPNTFIEKFFLNPNTERLLHLTRAKFPELLTPYLRVLAINGGVAYKELSFLKTYMNIITSGDLSYDNDTEGDTIILKDGVYINPPYEQNKDVLLFLPPNTKGKIIPTADRNTDAVIFHYDYNGWSLLGRIVQNLALYGENTEVLLVILDLLTSSVNSSDIDTISEIFEKMSAFLDDSDILDIILKLFEQSLHQRNSKVVVAIINFFSALVYTYPQIVWSHLARSDLLEHTGRGGLINTILGSVEAVCGDFDFSISCLKLYNELVINSLVGSEDLNTHKSNVLPRFTSFAIHVFESFIYWNFNEPHQKYQIATLALDSFTKILYSIYGVDLDTDPEKKVTHVLASSAKKILHTFTVALPDVRVIKPIFALLTSVVEQPSMFKSGGKVGFWFTQGVRISLEFSKLVISIRSLLGAEPCTLEREFFNNATELVRAYSQHISLRADILQLLTQLVGVTWNSEPPSLLSHLREYYTNVLLSSLRADLELIHDDIKVKKYIYSFFSAVILGKQKGLSMIFINGSEYNKLKQQSLLRALKKDVQNLDYYPASLGIHLVDSIAFALNSWSYNDEDGNKDFIETLVKMLSTLGSDTPSDNNSTIERCYAYKLNSRIAEICALIIFTSKDGRGTKPITDALQNTDILNLIKPLYEPFGYRSSLHVNLNRNFEEKWPSLKLNQFVRTPLTATTTYGEGAVYDLGLLDDILNQNPFWTGSGLTEGYRSEVISASLNLQYVSAQIGAAKSWGALLTAYAKRHKTHDSFWDIIKKLLQANISEGTSVSLFSEVYRVRVELAFFFLYLITGTKKLEDSKNREILELSLKLICSPDADFLAKLSINQSDVYRPLLRILSNSLNAALGDSKLTEKLSAQLSEFAEVVLAKGTTILLDAVQSDINTPAINGRIEDMFLIMSLVKGVIATNPPAFFMAKFTHCLVDYSTLRALLNTYSNSHNLRVDEEPIFAELSLTYMIELISVDSIAEQLISNGLFSTLIESPLSVRVQQGNVLVHTTPRLHNIWSNGLLAIVLILLGKFGVRLLPEISGFVSYFSKQIYSNTKSWSQETVAITFPALQETEQIILLQKALRSLFEEYTQTTSTVSPESIDSIPGMDSTQDIKDLSKSLVHLLAHPKYLTSRIIPTTLEEQKMFEGEDKLRTPLVEKLVAQIKELNESISE